MDEPAGVWNPARIFSKFLFSPTLGQRSLAMLIDLALVSLLQLWLSQVFGTYQPNGNGANNAVVLGDGLVFSGGQLTSISSLWLAVIVVVYFTYFEAAFGATPGKALLRLRVVLLDGGRPPFGSILIRNVLRLVDVLPFFYIVGGLVAESTVHEQRVGDIVARTTVVTRSPLNTESSRVPRLRTQLAITGVLLALLLAGCLAYQYFARPTLILQSWANANNAYLSAQAYNNAKAHNCGPMPEWPDPQDIAANSSVAGDSARPILQYALGAPQWGSGTVTYPIAVQVWDDARDSGQYPTSPQRVSLSDLDAGPDVFTGRVILTWVGPLNGGWYIQGGSMNCASAG